MKRVYIALAVLAVALVGVTAWRVTQPPDEPVYKGKPLSEWLNAYAKERNMKSTRSESSQQSSQQMEPAVRQAGTNAIPTLLRFLRMKDSPLKVKLILFVQGQQIVHFEYIPADCRNVAALQGFLTLGTNAESAVPELIDIANQNISPYSRSCAIESLGFTGPAAKAAVPSLVRWATNANVQVRSTAISVLRNIDPEAAAKAGITNAP